MMEHLWVISIITIGGALCAALLIFNAKKRRKLQSKAKANDYETLIIGLRQQIDAQKELVKALTDAVELSINSNAAGIDTLMNEVGKSAREQLADENARLKSQLAFLIEVERKRDAEFGAPRALTSHSRRDPVSGKPVTGQPEF